MSRERERNFSPSLRRQVWKEQGNKCAICGTTCKGHGAKRRGQVHHIWPVAFGGSARRKNAAGLCEPCHKEADRRVFEEGKTIDE